MGPFRLGRSEDPNICSSYIHSTRVYVTTIRKSVQLQFYSLYSYHVNIFRHILYETGRVERFNDVRKVIIL